MASIARRPDGRYRVRWREYPGAPERSRQFDRKVDAQRFADSIAGDIVRGHYVDPKAGRETIGAYAKRWSAAQVWRQSSRDRMVHIIESRIIPKFGQQPLAALRRSEVQGWVAEMSNELAPSTVEAYYRTLAAVMRAAVADELVRKSPCIDITLPKKGSAKNTLVPLVVAQVVELSEAVPRQHRALILASAGLGLRQGEACGLTVDRIDFLRRTVTIDRQLITPKGSKVSLGPVKTDASNRTMPLPKYVADVLAAHLAEFPVGADGFVFTSTTGAPLRRSVYGSTFRRAARSIGLDATSHDLRHHCASLLIRSGLSVKAIQAYLGHATAAETLDTYGHLWPDDEERIRAAVDAAFDPFADFLRTSAV